MKNEELILIIDFYGQYNQLIARRVRECNVYSEIVPFNTSIEKIKERIKELFNVGAFLSKNLTFFTNVRQITLLKSAIESLEEVEKGINEQMEIDMIEIDLKLVWEKLGDIIGANYTEELIDNLFSRFCLGK